MQFGKDLLKIRHNIRNWGGKKALAKNTNLLF